MVDTWMVAWCFCQPLLVAQGDLTPQQTAVLDSLKVKQHTSTNCKLFFRKRVNGQIICISLDSTAAPLESLMLDCVAFHDNCSRMIGHQTYYCFAPKTHRELLRNNLFFVRCLLQSRIYVDCPATHTRSFSEVFLTTRTRRRSWKHIF